jgi:hypothetical protein
MQNNLMTRHQEVVKLLRGKALAGQLREPFRGSDINRILGVTWGPTFLAKYATGNGYTAEYFVRIASGLYRFRIGSKVPE